MNKKMFSRDSLHAAGILAFVFIFSLQAVWSQDGQRDRRRPRRDPSSFMSAYRDDDFAASLKLTAEQKTKLDKFRGDLRGLRDKFREPDEFARAAKEIDEKAVAELNDTQKTVWETKRTELFAEDAKEGRNNTANSANQNTAPATPAASSNEKKSETTQPVARGSIPDEKPPEGAIAVASFGANAKPKGEAAAAEVAEPTTDAKPITGPKLKEEANLVFNFRYAAWADVLKLFAEANDLSLDLNDVPPGTFNYWDNQKYTMTEALDVLNGYLLSKGYVLIRRDRFLVCWNIAENPVPPSVVPNVTEEQLLERGKNELLTLILPLDGLDAEKIVTDVKELLGPLSKAHAVKSTNSLVLTDIGSNLRWVNNLLKSSKPIDNRDTAFKSIALKNISAADAERIVRRHFGLNPPVTTSTAAAPGGFGGRGFPGFGGGFGGFGGGGFRGRDGGGDGGGGGGGGQPPQGGQPQPAQNAATQSPFAGKIQVTADIRGNFLLVTASAPLIKVVEELVKILDTNVDANGVELNAKNIPVYFQGYSVPGSDVAALSRMFNNIIPGVVVGEDARSGKIYIQGTKEEHAEIQRLIKASTDADGTTQVFQLMKLDPAQLANTLKNLFINESPRAPSIEFDANGRKILVRGTPEQLNQVRSLLEKLGESTITNGTDESGNPVGQVDRGNIRRLNLGNHDPEDVLEMARTTWNASGHSPFRVVVPSKPNPIRDRRVPGERRSIDQSMPNEADTAPPQRRQTTRPRDAAPAEQEPAFRIRTRPLDQERKRDADDDKASNHQPATKLFFSARSPVTQASQSVLKEISDEVEQPRRGPSEILKEQTKPEHPIAETAREPLAQADDDAINDDDAIAQQTTDDSKIEKLIGEPLRSQPADVPGTAAPPPIGVTVMGNELVLTSPDTKALDQLEDMISALITAMPQRTRWTVFYLRSADATESAQMIERLFPQSSVTTSQSSDNLFSGSFGSGLSSFGRSMMNATGMNQSTLGSGQPLKVITDVRSNALFVAGPKDVITDIEYLLQMLDATDLPGTIRDRYPRTIPVEYADVDEVAEIIESVFKDSMTPEAQQQAGPPNPFAAMFQGPGRGMQGGNNNNARKPQGVELTIGVDKRTSNIIVSCNETLFQRIETMVEELDQRAKEANRTVKLVPLKTADPSVVTSTLTSLMPRVTVGTTHTKAKKPDSPASPGQPGGMPTPDPTRDAQMIQRMNQQRGGGGGGNNFNQGGGGGNFNRGNNQGGGGMGGGNNGGGGGNRRTRTGGN